MWLSNKNYRAIKKAIKKNWMAFLFREISVYQQ